MPTHAQIKKLVIAGRKPNQSPKLIIVKHEDEMVATNSYWLAPVSSVRPLLEQFNLPADVEAVYSVGSKVDPIEGSSLPNIAAIMPNVEACSIISPELCNDRPVYVKPAGDFLAVFRNGDALSAFNAEYLDFLTYGNDVRSIPCGGYGFRLAGEIIYRQTTALAPVRLSVKREKKSGGHNAEGADGHMHYVAETWADDGEQFLGLLMPVRI